MIRVIITGASIKGRGQGGAIVPPYFVRIEGTAEGLVRLKVLTSEIWEI